MIWILFALFILPCLLLLFKGGRENDAEANPVVHYKRQLAELEEDVKNRVLTKEAAAGARLEIERRILSVAGGQEKHKHGLRGGLQVPVVISLVLLVASFAGYSQLGSPNAQSKPGQVVSLLDTPVTKDGPSYQEAIDKLTAHLAENPDDRQGWEVLAKSARSVRSFSVAAGAFGELVRLQPEDRSWRVQQLEAYIAMARGQITPAAVMLVDALLEVEPNHPAGHYYLGLSRLQAGNEEAAKAIWTALADRSAANAPWMPTVTTQLERLGVAPPKLSQNQIDMVADMSSEEQDSFVRSMIARLEARLDSAPDDAEGWMMLARSQAALGEKGAAIVTLTRALDLVSADNKTQIQAFLDNLQESIDP